MNKIYYLLFLTVFIGLSFVQTYSQKLNEPANGDDILPTAETEEKDKSDIAADNKWKLERGLREYNLEYGISPFNPSNFAGPKEYDVYGRDLHQNNFRVGRVIGTKKSITYQYLFGFTPIAVFTRNEIKNPNYVSETATPNLAPTVRVLTKGVGIQPVNFRFVFFSKSRLKPYAQVGAGILLTERSIPVPRSTAFNFTGDYGGGLMFMTGKKQALTGGYRYFHISNGNIGGKINNPGYNANVFYVGYSFFK